MTRKESEEKNNEEELVENKEKNDENVKLVEKEELEKKERDVVKKKGKKKEAKKKVLTQHLPYPHAPTKKDKERQYARFLVIFKKFMKEFLSK